MKSVCVVGAGASGLAAVKSCLEEGLQPTCFEKADTLGGLWHYTEDPKPDQATVFKSTHLNTCKLTSCFSDFPMPPEWPNFPHHSQVYQYLQMYAQHFDLTCHIRLTKEVQKIEQNVSQGSPLTWKVTVTDISTGDTVVHSFDFVIVCCGIYRRKNIPNIKGLESFKGQVLHTHDYTNPMPFNGKRVVVLGFGNSGTDAAVEMSRVAKVYQSIRSPTWIIRKITTNGRLLEEMFFSRSKAFMLSLKSKDDVNEHFEKICKDYLDPSLYGMEPKLRFSQTTPVLNDELAIRLNSGSLKLMPNITEVKGKTVHFEDGTSVDDIDTILLATGYSPVLPAMDEGLQLLKGGHSNLYKFVFPTNVEQTSLACVGLMDVIGSHFMGCELQARWIARVFSGKASLPPSDVMTMAVAKQQALQEATYAGNLRNVLRISVMVYGDSIANEIGCRPNMLSLLLKDPLLAWRVWFGMLVPAQYRLQGPGAWTGACDIIVNQEKHMWAAFKAKL